MKPHSSYVYGLSGHRHRCPLDLPPPPDEDLRAEDPDHPNVGDLIQPGALVETSYGTGPYMVDRVVPVIYYDRYRAWSIVGHRADRDGAYRKDANLAGYLNELVADWSTGKPRILHLFRANTDEVVILDGRAYAQDRRGQGLLL